MPMYSFYIIKMDADCYDRWVKSSGQTIWCTRVFSPITQMYIYLNDISISFTYDRYIYH